MSLMCISPSLNSGNLCRQRVPTSPFKDQSQNPGKPPRRAERAMGSKCTTTRRKRRDDESCLSFSARLPAEAQAKRFSNCICAVKWSSNPFADFRTSIAEIIREVGVHDWEELEELVYCYIALNPENVHGVIKDAFVSLWLSRIPSVSDTTHYR